MNIRLNELAIDNFKGIKTFEMVLDGGNAVIKAENGIGKTSVYDAFLWLLFGKNSEGKADFNVRPLDADNQPIKGLVVDVVAVVAIDEVTHVFHKEQREKVTRGKFKGYETLCWIDEVPKKISEYQAYIAELIAEDTFKLLTDLNHFSGKLHHTERREALLAIAGEVGTPEGFDELTEALNYRSMDEYQKVLTCRKLAYKKERDEINPRIDEIQKGLDEYVVDRDIEVLPARRESLQEDIKILDGQRQLLFNSEKQRQEKIDLVNELTKKRTQREGELATDTSGVNNLLTEKATIEAHVAEKSRASAQIQTNWDNKQTEMSSVKRQLESILPTLVSVQAEYKTTSEAKADETCYACGQNLPADKMATAEQDRKNRLAEITSRGNSIMADVETCKKLIEQHASNLAKLTKQFDESESALETAESERESKFADIDQRIAANETTPPNTDPTWLAFDSQIKSVEKEIGEPSSEQLQQIDNQRTEKQDALENLNKALAQADTMVKSKARIAELETQEIELAQKITDVEKELAAIDGYKTAQSQMIELSVNSKFKHVKFKLFKELLNGGSEPCCEATFNGVPYRDLSAGQKIFIGIDITNVLSAHYGVSVPLFIDHAESLTLPIEAETQIIKLFAQSGINELVIEKE